MATYTHRLSAVEQHLRGDDPASWETPEQPLNIIDFATNERYLNKSLFPRQATVLKIMALAEELFTAYDWRVISEWEGGFRLTGYADGTAWAGTLGTPGDLLKRMGWNRARRRRWFHQIELLFGRRGSKNFLVTIFMAWVLWQLISHDDPHETFGIDPLKRISALVFAGKKDAAIRNQVRDLVQVICTSPAFEAFHPIPSSEGVVLFTPKQIAGGVDVNDRTKALVEIRAAETTHPFVEGHPSTDWLRDVWWDRISKPAFDDLKTCWHVVAFDTNDRDPWRLWRNVLEVLEGPPPGWDRLFDVEPLGSSRRTVRCPS
jgi:hypothetical protein